MDTSDIVELTCVSPGILDNTIHVRIRTGPIDDTVSEETSRPYQRWTVTLPYGASFRGQFIHSYKGKKRRSHRILPAKARECVVHEGKIPPHIDDLRRTLVNADAVINVLEIAGRD
jgi:hypothetical protein